MDLTEPSIDWAKLVASVADSCMKPWKHAVICENLDSTKSLYINQELELIMRIECRTLDGERLPGNDLDLEIYCSGKQLNLMLCWSNKPDSPILWQGSHSVWMNGETGQRCHPPTEGSSLETFARRLRTIFDLPNNET